MLWTRRISRCHLHIKPSSKLLGSLIPQIHQFSPFEVPKKVAFDKYTKQKLHWWNSEWLIFPVVVVPCACVSILFWSPKFLQKWFIDSLSRKPIVWESPKFRGILIPGCTTNLKAHEHHQPGNLPQIFRVNNNLGNHQLSPCTFGLKRPSQSAASSFAPDSIWMASTCSSLLVARTCGQQNYQHGNPEEPILFPCKYNRGHYITNQNNAVSKGKS